MQLVYLGFLFFSFLACNSEQNVTEFNVLIKAPLGEDMDLQTDEDEELYFEYEVKKLDNSVNPKLFISKAPVNGEILDCKEIEPTDTDKFKIGCTYKPKQDFYGIDYLEFKTKDGDIKSSEASVVTINVLNIPDAPIAYDQSFTTGSKIPVVIMLPEGSDTDSTKGELSYEIITQPTNGELSNCNNRTCTYISESLFEGEDQISYQITDHTGLRSNIGKIKIRVNSKTYNAVETFNSDIDNIEGVDIVWVIDNSGSMKDEQEALKANFTSFINNFLVDGTPRFKFNMAITTTDSYKKSTPQNGFEIDENQNQYDLSSDKALSNFDSFKLDFEKAVNVGVDGSGSERSFESIEKSYVLNPNWFAGNKHLLAYIIVSDEKEQTNISVNDFYNQMSALKDKPQRVLFYPIIRKSSDTGDRYQTIAELSKTQIYDIEKPFSEILNSISLNVSSNIKSYNLNPNVNIIGSSVKVLINSVETTDFTYSDNKITLLKTPSGQTKIEVYYKFGVK